MTTTGIVSAVIFGVIIGAIGRLLVPGKEDMPIWLTIAVGVGAAFAGTGLVRLLDLKAHGFDFWQTIFQIGIAALAVFVVAALWPQRDESA
ncbi:MAG TPA: GlsB/YeaQ/YmgE family stress response membrane protein [Streptosporangiaceae bacterium]